jgi:hypothetical protein
METSVHVGKWLRLPPAAGLRKIKAAIPSAVIGCAPFPV